MMNVAFPQGPPKWPLPDEDVREALQRCYANGDWGKYEGPHAAALCERLREDFECSHVHLCSSGTIAVELALRGLKVGPGDEVILAAYDFPGNFRAIETVGARPVLVDVAPQRWTMDSNLLQDAITKETKAIIVSHLHGDLADMLTIGQLAKEHGLKVLEDACQVPGALIDDRPVGSFGDVSVLSFGGSKLLTSGRGGAVLTSQSDVAQRIRVYSFRGNDAFPLSELQAAVLLPQLAKLWPRTLIRGSAAFELQELLRDVPQLMARPKLPMQPHYYPAYYKLAWRYLPANGDRQSDCSQPKRGALICALQAQGIAIDAGFRGFKKRSANRCRMVGELINAQSAAETTLLLHHPILLHPDQINLLAETMQKVIAELG
jgi:perosamine synthetase